MALIAAQHTQKWPTFPLQRPTQEAPSSRMRQDKRNARLNKHSFHCASAGKFVMLMRVDLTHNQNNRKCLASPPTQMASQFHLAASSIWLLGGSSSLCPGWGCAN